MGPMHEELQEQLVLAGRPSCQVMRDASSVLTN